MELGAGAIQIVAFVVDSEIGVAKEVVGKEAHTDLEGHQFARECEELDFVRGQLGRLPAPEWAFDKLGDLLSSLILLGQDYAEISELSVTEGRMTFVGRVTG